MADHYFESDPIRARWPELLRKIKQQVIVAPAAGDDHKKPKQKTLPNPNIGWAPAHAVLPVELNSLFHSGLVITTCREDVHLVALTGAGKSIITGEDDLNSSREDALSRAKAKKQAELDAWNAKMAK